MDLRNWEFYESGDALVGATVRVREAVLTHPNADTILASTTTDVNGAWAFTGLTNTPKDVEVIWGSTSQYHRWYKGMTRHNVGYVFHTEDGMAVSVWHDAAQSIANNTLTTLAFNQERYDTHAMHDNVTNNSRIVAKAAGKYMVYYVITWAANAVGTRQIFVIVNGGPFPTNTVVQDSRGAVPSAGFATSQAASKVIPLVENDYVEVQVKQDSGGALSTVASTSTVMYGTDFGMIRIN